MPGCAQPLIPAWSGGTGSTRRRPEPSCCAAICAWPVPVTLDLAAAPSRALPRLIEQRAAALLPGAVVEPQRS